MLMNVHGSMELSDVMITAHFTAQLSDYGFTQLAVELEEVSDTWPRKPPPLPESPHTGKLSKKSDVLNFGMVLLAILGAPRVRSMYKHTRTHNIKLTPYIDSSALEC